MEKKECIPLLHFQEGSANLFPPSEQTWNILADGLNKECQVFSKFQMLLMLLPPDNWRCRHTTLFPASLSNRVRSLFLQAACPGQGDDDKKYQHNQRPFFSGFDSGSQQDIFWSPIRHKDRTTYNNPL